MASRRGQIIGFSPLREPVDVKKTTQLGVVLFFLCGEEDLAFESRLPAVPLQPPALASAYIPVRYSRPGARSFRFKSSSMACGRKKTTRQGVVTLYLCGEEDLNLHTSRHQHLKLACLPIPPSPQNYGGILTIPWEHVKRFDHFSKSRIGGLPVPGKPTFKGSPSHEEPNCR